MNEVVLLKFAFLAINIVRLGRVSGDCGNLGHSEEQRVNTDIERYPEGFDIKIYCTESALYNGVRDFSRTCTKGRWTYRTIRCGKFTNKTMYLSYFT